MTEKSPKTIRVQPNRRLSQGDFLKVCENRGEFERMLYNRQAIPLGGLTSYEQRKTVTRVENWLFSNANSFYYIEVIGGNESITMISIWFHDENDAFAMKLNLDGETV